METNRSIDISRRIYAGLLALYPQEHRAEYGADMTQLFTDQCRAAKNRRDLAALWLRALIDLVFNVVREQLSSPHRSLGLLEAPPNAPLPWKGVALVLIPGLIFFISQVAQLTGKDWFFLVVYRSALFLILPVVVVWAWKRKFPVWGLIPLGLLARTALTLGYTAQFRWLERQKAWRDGLNSLNHALVLPLVTEDTLHTIMMIGVGLVCLSVLGWVILRGGIPRRTWAWLGAYILVIAATIGLRTWDVPVETVQHTPNGYLPFILEFMYEYLYTYGGFLALILTGALLARRHGRLAALLPLGFLLPTVLFGRMVDDWPSATSPDFTLMLLITAGTLTYRFLVALAGPLWIVRSANGQMQKRSSAISLIVLIVIQVLCNLIMLVYFYHTVGTVRDIYFAISEQLIIGAGIALALALYRPVSAEQLSQAGLQIAQVSER